LSGDLTDGSTDKRLNTFINDLRDHDATVSGDYDMTDLGGANSTKIFLSYNPAAVGGDYGGKKAPNDRKITFNGKLTLHGIATPNNSNVLVGMEHQIWAMKDRTHLQSSSTLLNTGDIILASGNNIVGIMIDVEQMHEKERKSHKTINNGRIIINSNNSIGVDFGQYQYQGVFKVDVTLGNIIVNGKNNYGARMKNIFALHPSNPHYALYMKYYDLVKVTSGAGKKITVNGEENVGMAIGKSLSASKDSNPIGNILGFYIEVAGEKKIGFKKKGRRRNYRPSF